MGGRTTGAHPRSANENKEAMANGGGARRARPPLDPPMAIFDISICIFISCHATGDILF